MVRKLLYKMFDNIVTYEKEKIKITRYEFRFFKDKMS